MPVLAGHGVLARALAMVDEGLVQLRDALCQNESGGAEHEVLGEVDLLVAEVVVAHEVHAKHFVPREVAEAFEHPIGVVAPCYNLGGKLVAQDGPTCAQGDAVALVELAVGEGGYVGPRALEQRHGLLEQRRVAPVVGVEEVQVIAPGPLDAPVARRAGSGVLLVKDADAVVARGVVGQQLRGAVGGAVVHADHL